MADNHKQSLKALPNPDAFLWRIMKNSAIDHIRKSNRRESHEGSIDDLALSMQDGEEDALSFEHFASTAARNPGEDAELRQMLGVLQDAPEEIKQCLHVIILKVVEGWDHKELAEYLGFTRDPHIRDPEKKSRDYLSGSCTKVRNYLKKMKML